MRVHPDYIAWKTTEGKKRYTPKLIGGRTSVWTFGTATEAKNYRVRFMDRYWRLKKSAEPKTATISPDSSVIGVSSEMGG